MNKVASYLRVGSKNQINESSNAGEKRTNVSGIFRMRSALYLRVSTEEQAKEGYSIEAQKNRLIAFTQSQEWSVFDIYIDEGISAKPGSIEMRPELCRMLADIKDGHIDVVLVLRLDRLTRSVLDLYKLLEVFETYNCAFRSATEVYDTTTPTGKLFITIVAAMAQWERETIAERVKEGMEQMVREGKWHGGPLPYGYDKELKIIEDEAIVVRNIFNKYNAGKIGEDNLAIWLNDNSYRKKGEIWKGTTVNYILQNPIYIGHLRWNKKDKTKETLIIENVTEPIISEETYYKAQELRQIRSELHPKSATSSYIFSGRIKCAKCGAPLKGQSTGEIKYYICTKKRTHECSSKRVREDDIEKLFYSKIEEFVELYEAPNEVAASFIAPITNLFENEINLINNDLKKIEIRRKNWIIALGNGDMTQKEYREHTLNDRELEINLNKRLGELGHLDLEADKTKKRSAYDSALLLKDLKLQWENCDSLEKKNLVQIVTDSIYAEQLGNRIIDMMIEFK